MTRMIVFVTELRRPIKENEENYFDSIQLELGEIYRGCSEMKNQPGAPNDEES